MPNALKILFKGLILLLLLPLSYFLLAFILNYFPSSSRNTLQPKERVYLSYNDTHSDILLSLEQIPPQYHPFFKNIYQHPKGYLSFGWGDKETYLNTPTWDDLKPATAFKALFLNTPSVMHVQYFSTLGQLRQIKPIKLSGQQLHQLTENIFSSFDFKKESYRGYGRTDLFYNSPYPYNLFHTCNTWTGDQLRKIGVPMSYWTPLSSNIIASLP